MKLAFASDNKPSHASVMETLVVVLALATLTALAARFGTDSRLVDDDRATRWWPAQKD
jgi:hypothetical protein